MPSPKRRRAAPEGSTALRRVLGDTSRTTTLRARRGGAGVFFSVVGNRERRPRREWDNPLASQPDSLARLAYALRNRYSTAIHWEGRVARGLASKGDSPPDSPTAIRCPFAANPVVASAPTLRLQTELPTPRCLRPSLRGASDSAALITLYYKLRSLIWNPSTPFRDRSSCDCMSRSLRLPTGLANSGAAPASL